jgi:hypothetical protein
MKKQIGVAFCPTDEKRTIATFDKLSKVWITTTFNTKEK